MSGCCGEYRCRRKQPILLTLGFLTNAVYAVTRSRLANDHGDGTATFEAQEKHDVTAAMKSFIARNPQWVRERLAEVDDLAAEREGAAHANAGT